MKKCFLIFFLSFFYVPCVLANQYIETRKQEILLRWEALKPTYSGIVFKEPPSIKVPYSIGQVADGYLMDGLNMFNFMRFLAGLPSDVSLSADLTEQAQHGVVVLAATDTLTHWPTKPADMNQDFFDRGYKSTTSSNLGQAYASIPEVVLDWMRDDDNQLNISTLGHRRWVLSPNLLYTAFGVAGEGYQRYFAGQVFDNSRIGYVVPQYIIWPNSPAFPTEHFDNLNPWSVQLSKSVYQEPRLENVSITLTRVSDNRVWIFSELHNNYSERDRYFNIDSSGYGGFDVPYCIVFRPEGVDKYSGEYRVSVSGLKSVSGNSATIDYSVEFFSMNVNIPVTYVSLNKTSTTIYVGDAETLIPTIAPPNATNKNVTWRSSNTSVATVSNSGQVTGISGGTATITVTTEDGNHTATCEVTVNHDTTSKSGGGCNVTGYGLMALAGLTLLFRKKQ